MADNKNRTRSSQASIIYNPGNQSGKVADVEKPESEQENNRDRIEDRIE